MKNTNKIHLKNYKAYNKYMMEQKLYFINIQSEKSPHYISDTFGIDRKSLRDWMNKKDELENEFNKKKYWLGGNSFNNNVSKEHEAEIIDWIFQNRALGIGISISK